jgi:Uri superfamily endonuclease
MKGSYILLIELPGDSRFHVGRLGEIAFHKGFYAYVGSALNNLEKRVERHLNKEKKRFWHIDYLLERAEVRGVFYIESGERMECQIAENLRACSLPFKGFGSSDCDCISHLFHSKNLEILKSKTLSSFNCGILRSNLL